MNVASVRILGRRRRRSMICREIFFLNMNKKYIDFELQNGEFPKCEKCGLEGFFTDEFGIVNEKIYCIKCIEANNLQDQGKLESEKTEKNLNHLLQSIIK